jgi:hypothetical protein
MVQQQGKSVESSPDMWELYHLQRASNEYSHDNISLVGQCKQYCKWLIHIPVLDKQFLRQDTGLHQLPNPLVPIVGLVPRRSQRYMDHFHQFGSYKHQKLMHHPNTSHLGHTLLATTSQQIL